ncbi:uncharacterized protein LOC144112343 isoform X1 [Amblyomma americanum]
MLDFGAWCGRPQDNARTGWPGHPLRLRVHLFRPEFFADAHAMVTGHKSDYVVNLGNWYRSADDLVLHYELRLQTLPEGWERLRVSSQAQLKSLIASAPDAGIDNLFIAPEALRPFVSSCPQLLQRWRLQLMRREFLLFKVGEEPLLPTSEEGKELLIEAMRYHLMPEWRAAMAGPRTSAKQLAPKDADTHARPSGA